MSSMSSSVPSWSHLVSLAGVMLVGAMSPGPDFAVVFRNAAASGRRAGTATALGVAAGILVWSVVAAVGLAGLLAASAVAFTVVKFAGAAYLLYLGVRALLAARRGGTAARDPDGGGRVPMRRAFRDGLLCNLLNPKCAVFFVALVPQFLPAEPGALDTVLTALVPVVVTALWFTVVATVVGTMRALLAVSWVRRTVDAVSGALLVAVGVRLATQARVVS